MYSMTGIGFATAKLKETAKLKGATVDITVKSVNGRYLDLRLHLNDRFQKLEPEVRKKISEKIKRGSVTVVLDYKNTASSVSLDFDRAQDIFQQLKQLGKKLKLDSNISLESIIQFPNILKSENEAEISEADKKSVLKAVGDAIDLCNQERKREGQATQNLFKNFFSELKTNTDHILKNAHSDESEVSKKILDKLQKLGLQGEVDSQRLAQEVVIQLERSDVSEEAQRVLEHLSGMGKAVLSTDPVGKKLEFYTQELFREFNTIGSKSQDAEVTKVVIESKVIVERLREQVQNIE